MGTDHVIPYFKFIFQSFTNSSMKSDSVFLNYVTFVV